METFLLLWNLLLTAMLGVSFVVQFARVHSVTVNTTVQYDAKEMERLAEQAIKKELLDNYRNAMLPPIPYATDPRMHAQQKGTW